MIRDGDAGRQGPVRADMSEKAGRLSSRMEKGEEAQAAGWRLWGN